MNKRNKNGGFSLVEVIIAVTILSIIVTPLLRMFTSAARTNAKARKIMQSTTIAQNITEDLKAYSLRNISRSINNYTVDEYGNAFSIKITNADTYEAKCTENADGRIDSVVRVVKSEDVTPGGNADSSMSAVFTTMGTNTTVTSSKFIGNASNCYYFVMQNVSLENSPTKYDAVVKLESKYTTELASISSMNERDNAYYIEADGQEMMVAGEFAGRVPGGIVAATELKSRLSRQITITIEKDGSGNETVTLGTEYTCSSSYVPADQDSYTIPSRVIFNNFVSHQDLKSVYVYYYPIYASDAKDSFKVINTTGEKITVYFVSLIRNRSTLTSAQIANYKARLNISEDAMGITESSLNTKICSNVEQGKWTTVATVNDLGNTNSENLKYDATVWIYEHEDSFSANDDKYVMKFTASKLDLG